MSLRATFSAELPRLGLPAPSGPPPAPVAEAELASLPDAVQRYLRFMGVVGRPRSRSFRLGFSGRFKLSARAPWRRCEVWQHDTAPEITRTFFMQLRIAGLPVVGRDTYRDGHGRMVGKVLDLVKVIDGRGPEFDVSELVTYLNDLVLFAPSMLLVPAVRFAPVDARSFDVALTDHGITVRGRVLLDERGAPVDFETNDRFGEDPANPKRFARARWTTPTSGFLELDGRKVVAGGRAIWHLPGGEFPYAEFDVVPGSVAFDVRPGE